jgi:anti-anti-sigma regulatory factor
VASTISAVLDAIGPRPEAFILDLTAVPLADAAAANALRTFAQKALRRKTAVYIVGANERVRRALAANEVDESLVRFAEKEISARARINAA